MRRPAATRDPGRALHRFFFVEIPELTMQRTQHVNRTRSQRFALAALPLALAATLAPLPAHLGANEILGGRE